jgi:hypothetical protein
MSEVVVLEREHAVKVMLLTKPLCLFANASLLLTKPLCRSEVVVLS